MLRPTTPKTRKRRRPFRFLPAGAERLEDRCLLSITPLQPVDSGEHLTHPHGDHGPPQVSNQFIVVLKDGVNAGDFAAELRGQGRNILHVYGNALNGLAFRGQALAHDPRVLYVEPDVILRSADHLTPTGVDRMEADLNPLTNIDDIDGTVGDGQRVDVDVAVLDTGIDLDHADLNVYQTAYFIESSADDGHGHGTHVAGTIGALDNGLGVVGVAPGARIWAVKVLDASGGGTASSIIAGVDYVTAHADEIDVVNMSLAGQGSSVALHQAIQNSVAAGVVYAVAAGNSGTDIYGSNLALDPTANCLLGVFCVGTEDFFPASYPEVATIAALVDTDGEPGGAGGSTGYGADDSFASFSNYSSNMHPDNPVYSPGLGIDLLMPGVNILSTWNDGGYNTISGTSMATPHAAGLFGLYIAQMGRDVNGNGLFDAQDVSIIRQHLIDTGISQDAIGGLSTLNDPDGNEERLGWADLGDALFVTVGEQAITKIAEDGGSTTAKISRYGDVSSEVTINLSVSEPGTVALSTFSVTIAAGARTSDPFTITTIDNNVGDRDRVVTITASAAGFRDGTGRVTVLDEESQWASSVIGSSSQWDSGDGSDDWMAVQALGMPDTFGYGDIPTAYAPAQADGGMEWVAVEFDMPVYSSGAVVRETLGNGRLEKVEVREAGTNQYTTTWQGNDDSPQGEPVDFQVNWSVTDFLVDALRVTVNTAAAGWEEIDAIELLGSIIATGGDTTAPSVTVHSPDGGENWVAGSVQTIAWSATDDVGVTSVDLLYSTDNGGTYAMIAPGETNDGAYSWTVPETATSGALVKVAAHDAANNTGEDVSNAPFTISDQSAPVVTLIQPNGGESWAAGSTHQITWSAVDNIGVPSVDLSYSTDGGGTFVTIAAGETNDGIYSGTVPDTPSAGMVVRIVAYDAAGNSGEDLSDETFSIAVSDTTPPASPTGLQVTVPVSNGGQLNLDWENNGESDLAGYNVYRSTNTDGPFIVINGALVTSSSYADGGLTNGTTYYYVVRAVDTSGNESSDSNQDAGMPLDNLAPDAPANLTATASDGQVALDWDDNMESDLVGYNIYRSTNGGGSDYLQLNGSVVTTSAYLDTTAENGTTYYYVVTAIDDATVPNESTGSNETSATPQAADQMYIRDISWSEKHKGKGGAITDLYFTVDVRFDSDHDGIAEESDAALGGVTTTVSLLLDANNDDLYDDGEWGAVADTAGNGLAKFVLNDAPNGDYMLSVAIEHESYAWNIFIGDSFVSFYDGVPGGSETFLSSGAAVQSYATTGNGVLRVTNDAAGSLVRRQPAGPMPTSTLWGLLAETEIAQPALNILSSGAPVASANLADMSGVPFNVASHNALEQLVAILDNHGPNAKACDLHLEDRPGIQTHSLPHLDTRTAALEAVIDELSLFELYQTLDGN